MATPYGVIDVRLGAGGEHNVRNALAAAACAIAADVGAEAIAAGLNTWRPVAGRGVKLRINDCDLIDDTYNANPDSVRAAVDLLAGAPAPRVLVLGDMGEVGIRGPEFHREVGQYARERGIDALFAVGPLMREAVQAFGTDAVTLTRGCIDFRSAPEFSRGNPVLVKGSRYADGACRSGTDAAEYGSSALMLLETLRMAGEDIRSFNVFSLPYLRAVLAAATAMLIGWPRTLRDPSSGCVKIGQARAAGRAAIPSTKTARRRGRRSDLDCDRASRRCCGRFIESLYLGDATSRWVSDDRVDRRLSEGFHGNPKA